MPVFLSQLEASDSSLGLIRRLKWPLTKAAYVAARWKNILQATAMYRLRGGGGLGWAPMKRLPSPHGAASHAPSEHAPDRAAELLSDHAVYGQQVHRVAAVVVVDHERVAEREDRG